MTPQCSMGEAGGYDGVDELPPWSVREMKSTEFDVVNVEKVIASAFGHAFPPSACPIGFGKEFAWHRHDQAHVRAFVAVLLRQPGGGEDENAKAEEAAGEQIIGSIFGTVFGSYAFLGPLTIVPERQGRGVGTGLIRSLLAALERDQIRSVGLFTFFNSPRHDHIYRKAGFRSMGPTRLYHKRVGGGNGDSVTATSAAAESDGDCSSASGRRTANGYTTSATASTTAPGAAATAAPMAEPLEANGRMALPPLLATPSLAPLEPAFRRHLWRPVLTPRGAGAPAYRLFSEVGAVERRTVLAFCAQICDAQFAGLDLRAEVRTVDHLNLGDTIFVGGNGECCGLNGRIGHVRSGVGRGHSGGGGGGGEDDPVAATAAGCCPGAFAVCHHGAGTEGGALKLYAKFAAAADAKSFDALLAAVDDFAARAGLAVVEVGANSGNHDAVDHLVAAGFVPASTHACMLRGPGSKDVWVNNRHAFVCGDWR